MKNEELPRVSLPEAAAIPLLEPAPLPDADERPGRSHLVVVLSRAARPEDQAGDGAVLVTRFWHPRDQRWSENFFESLDHALRLFVDETGWTLLQQQALAGPHEHELSFQARRGDFSNPSTEDILEDVGLTPKEVKKLLEGDKPSA